RGRRLPGLEAHGTGDDCLEADKASGEDLDANVEDDDADGRAQRSGDTLRERFALENQTDQSDQSDQDRHLSEQIVRDYPYGGFERAHARPPRRCPARVPGLNQNGIAHLCARQWVTPCRCRTRRRSRWSPPGFTTAELVSAGSWSVRDHQMPVHMVAPGIEAVGPDPELSARVRALQARARGVG